MEARRYLVSGIVQGVGFRWFTEHVARDVGVVGWVRNLSDGRVEIHAEAEDLSPFLARIETGPRAARVSGIEASERAPQGFGDFEIRRTALEPE